MISAELLNAQWLCNSDTGLLFPQTGGIAVTGNIGPYWPTEEEILVGKRLPRTPVISPAAPPEPEISVEYIPETLDDAEAAEPPAEAPPKRGPGRPRGVVSLAEG